MSPNNPFAILRLAANATASEIKSAGQLALAKLRLGDPDNSARIREVEYAIEQLRDPVIRFKKGLEWPSLGPSAAKLLATDEAFATLTSDPGKDRSSVTNDLMNGESAISKDHISAVFLLMRANALFTRAMPIGISSNQMSSTLSMASASEFFSTALEQWVRATSSREFWMAQRLRAKEINDPRVNADLITSCEREVFAISTRGFAAMASNALLLRNAEVCNAIVKGIKSSGADGSNINGVLSEIYKPLCSRIESAIETLQTKLKSTKSKSVIIYSGLLDEYVRDIQPDVALLLIVGDLPGTTEERCRDSAAQFLRSLSVDSANNADAYDVSKKATQLAQQVVDSAQIRKTLAENMATITGLIAASRCVYCKNEMADGEPGEYQMFKVTERGFMGGMSYLSATIPIPRCAACQSKHSRNSNVIGIVFVTLAISGVIIGGTIGGCCSTFGGLVLSCILSTIVAMFFFSSEGDPKNYKPVADRFAEGWKKGDKPGKYS